MLFAYALTYFMVTVCCFLIGLVYLFQLSSDMGRQHELNSLRAFIVCYLVFVSSNMFWIWGNNGYINISGTLNSMVNLLSVCVASFFWFRYVEIKLNPDIYRSKYFNFVSFIPLGIVILMIVSSPLTGMVFRYEGHEYVHGPLYSTMFVLAVVYLIYPTVHILLNIRRVKTRSQRIENMTTAMFLFFPVLAGAIDIAIPNLPVMELSILFALCLVFSTLQKTQMYIDSLTQLNNRRRADDYLDEMIGKSSETEPLYLFIGDIDRFKSINDTYGHIEGDKILRIVSEVLRDYADEKRSFVARWGGDEFVLIALGSMIKEPDRVPEDIQERLNKAAKDNELPFHLGMTLGYCKCVDPKVSTTALVRAADERMYEKKKEKAEII